jgi:hypothetical protein
MKAWWLAVKRGAPGSVHMNKDGRFGDGIARNGLLGLVSECKDSPCSPSAAVPSLLRASGTRPGPAGTESEARLRCVAYVIQFGHEQVIRYSRAH